jgi:predicted  nucleic acid-binding Zn-ribbon protein
VLLQKRQLEEELATIRQRNKEDAEQIERLNQDNEHVTNDNNYLTGQIRALEYDISKSLNRVEDLNRLIDQKGYDLKTKESQLIEAESEVIQLKNQQANFQSELTHLKGVEERYRQENADLQGRIDKDSDLNS